MSGKGCRSCKAEERKTNLQQIKEDIKNVDSAAEMAGVLAGINAAAVVWCAQHSKEEKWIRDAGNVTAKNIAAIKG